MSQKRICRTSRVCPCGGVVAAPPTIFAASRKEDDLIYRAMAILARRIRQSDALTSRAAMRDYLRLLLGRREHEVFVVIFLDHLYRVICVEEMFRGTLSRTHVYPREVAKAALAANAAAVVFAHCHPSGSCEASVADISLTSTLSRALGLFDIHVLDHFIVAGDDVLSFAEQGMLSR